MGGRALLYLVLLLLVGSAGAWGWVHAWQKDREVKDTEFARQRVRFLEAENRHLQSVLTQREAAAQLAEERSLRAEIEQAVADLSGHQFRHPVTFKEIPRSELAAVLDQKLAWQVPDEEFGKVGLELTALGLIPPGTDLKKTYLGLLGEQVGAFYDQHTHELFTFSDHPLRNAQNRVIMAHELTHAMQDQQYDLLKIPLEVKGNDDLALACSALVEGDATVVMNRYLVSNLSAAALRDSLSGALTTDVRQLAAAPRYLRESLLFPYLRGQLFVEAITAENGPGAVTAAFRDPPNSTSEILHPERFLASPRRRPVEIDFGEAEIQGHPPALKNVLGEFTTAQILGLWREDKASAETIAAGWDGDAILVYGHPGAYSYLWQGVWRDENTAADYLRAARSGLEPGASAAAKGQAVSEQGLSSEVTFTTAGRTVRLLRHGNRTTLINAQDDAWRDALTRLAGAAKDKIP